MLTIKAGAATSAALGAILLASACGQPAMAGTGGLRVSVGFADTRTPAARGTFPSPWSGAPRTRFVGQGGGFAAGAVRIDNTSGRDLHLDSLEITAGGRRWAPWPRDLLVPAHASLILTQTPGGALDTAAGGSCSAPSNAVPVLRLTAGGVPLTLRDQGRVLSNGGRDLGACGGGNASHQWLAVGSVPGAEEVRDSAMRPLATLALLALLGLGLVAGLAAWAWTLGRHPAAAHRRFTLPR